MRHAEIETSKRGIVDRSLGLFATVHRGEGRTALLLMINVFILLTAYYVVKPVREALILGESGAEIKSYASAGQAALFLLIIPLYGKWASRVNRVWLMNGVMAFFIANLGLFFILGRLGASLGIAFYLWVGLFNLMLVAQFWAFANDIYTQEKGERLFGVVGIGASLGAIFGAMLAGWMIEPVGPYSMMLVSAGLLGIAMILTNWIHHREKRSNESTPGASTSQATEQPLGTTGGFRLILNNRYLLFIALLVLISNCVNTTGEFILGKTVAQSAQTMTTGAADAALAAKAYIGHFYADFFFWVNLVGAGLQMFAVSRLMQWWGARTMLFVLPIIALGGYAMLAVIPVLGLIRVAKIFENSVDYSIQNTSRHALFLPTSREEKYKAKAAIDGFFWRAGDTVSGLLVFAGTQLAFASRAFAAVNLVLVAVWIGIALAIARHGKRDGAVARAAA
jgi:AAA family ATP:ADP antiporter